MKKNILYLGDTALDRQACYLTGMMSYHGLGFNYVNSDEKFSDYFLSRNYDLMIVSDYPACNFSVEQAKAIIGKIKDGMGFLMVGGWESFVGDGGDYNNSLFAEVLPVIMKNEDDRVNFSSPCVITKENEHEIINNLPFDKTSSIIGGLNAVEIKKGALEILSGIEYQISIDSRNVSFEKDRKFPLLVIGECRLGKIAVFTSDVAPHWVGPFVDWGNERIRARADGSEAIEVGNLYAQFFANLLQWLCVKNHETISLI